MSLIKFLIKHCNKCKLITKELWGIHDDKLKEGRMHDFVTPLDAT